MPAGLSLLSPHPEECAPHSDLILRWPPKAALEGSRGTQHLPHPSRRAQRALLRMRSECGALRLRMRIALKLRHLHLFCGDELQQRRLALLRRLDPAPDRRDNVGRVLDALAIAAERLCELRVVAGD